MKWNSLRLMGVIPWSLAPGDARPEIVDEEFTHVSKPGHAGQKRGMGACKPNECPSDFIGGRRDQQHRQLYSPGQRPRGDRYPASPREIKPPLVQAAKNDLPARQREP